AKWGRNEYDGSAFELRGSGAWAARDPFAQIRPLAGTTDRFIPPTLWNQFGGSLGAPIQRDKTFVFGDYQGQRQKNGGSLTTRVPPAAERGGDLSGLNTPLFNPRLRADRHLTPAPRPPITRRAIPPAPRAAPEPQT